MFSEKYESYGKQFLEQKRFSYVFLNIFPKTKVLNFPVFFSESYYYLYLMDWSYLQKKTNRGSWYKNWSFSEHYFEKLELSDWKTIVSIKNYEFFWTFPYITNWVTWIIPKIVPKRLRKTAHLLFFRNVGYIELNCIKK
jgi:hypothetical protein